jgi:hypothetical protein
MDDLKKKNPPVQEPEKKEEPKEKPKVNDWTEERTLEEDNKLPWHERRTFF